MTTSVTLDPAEVLQQLKAGAKSSRTVKSLNIIYEVCQEQYDRGSSDFSYSMIGALSEKKGGPKAQPIRNATGAAYRTLVASWEKFSKGTIGKARPARNQGLDADVLSMIDDPVLRILVQNYISENKKLRNENQVLKIAAKEKIIIDMSGGLQSRVEVVMAVGFLLQQEVAALRNAISPEFFRKHGWTVNEQTGAVNRGALPVFSPGYVTAITKILGEVGGA